MKQIAAIKKVITPIDFSENALLVAESAAYIAGSFKATLSLVFVVQNFDDYSGFFVPQVNMPDIEQEIFASAEQRMDAFCEANGEKFKAAGISAIESKVLIGDVKEQLLAYALAQNGDLIIMGTHGYKGLEKIMFGSVADYIVKNSTCPVMTINPYTCCDRKD